MALWTGSITADSVLTDNPTPALQRINMALDSVNASQITTPLKDVQLMSLKIKDIYGVAGTYEVFEAFSGLFQDDADYLDAEEYEEEYSKWSFTRKGYAVKNGSFDRKTFKDAEERKKDLEALVEKRTVDLLATVQNIYKPNIIFETLLTAPTTGGGFYSKFGFARGTVVNARKLIAVNSAATAGDLGSINRTNYRSVAKNTGLSLEDISFYKQYMGEYEGVNEENLVVYGNSASLQQLKNLFSDFSPTNEEIIVNGIPTGIQGFTVNGLTLVGTKMLPANTLVIINPDAPFIITRLQSDLPKYRGVTIETPTEEMVGATKDLAGSKILINEEGYAA